ncbi:MAG: hypothetical protein NTY25_15740, partial [Planctomycetia bacterium]|nr:hypothetical protein [Planctomycetia bacterium]
MNKRERRSFAISKSSTRASASSDVIGIFRRAAGGYGFVHPLEAPAGDRSADMRIAAPATL